MSSGLKIGWTSDGWADYIYWQGQDKKTLRRINDLILDIQRDPFVGIGKPEPLRAILSGSWSRRIDDANRLVYEIASGAIVITSCCYHYAT